MQLAAIVISLVTSVIGIALAARTAAYIYQFVKVGQPEDTRTGNPAQRTKTVAREFSVPYLDKSVEGVRCRPLVCRDRFLQYTILGMGICILVFRGLEGALAGQRPVAQPLPGRVRAERWDAHVLAPGRVQRLGSSSGKRDRSSTSTAYGAISFSASPRTTARSSSCSSPGRWKGSPRLCRASCLGQ